MNWNLEEGVKYIKDLEEDFQDNKIGYHLALTGSVLYYGGSNKDLDVMVYPHDTTNCIPVQEVKNYLKRKLSKFNQIDRLKYPDEKDVCWSEREDGKRIDFFFVK